MHVQKQPLDKALKSYHPIYRVFRLINPYKVHGELN